MYISCSIPFENNAYPQCLGVFSDSVDASDGANYFSCSVPLENLNAFAYCGGTFSTGLIDALPSLEYLFDVSSYRNVSNYVNNPADITSSTVSSVLTVSSEAVSTPFDQFTKADYVDLSTWTTTVLLLAFGIRVIRSLLVSNR